jgi:enoyl-CoA hydratase/carnithine racemase
VIARVQGVATAAGCQLVATCDLAVAAEQARFAVSGINVGLFCSTPGVALGRAMARKEAMEMLLTGEFIDAAEAARRGLINRAVPAENLDSEVQRLVDSICGKSPVAIAMGKQLFYQQLNTGLEAAYQLAAETMACNMMTDDAAEGIDAFIQKRTPTWRGT